MRSRRWNVWWLLPLVLVVGYRSAGRNREVVAPKDPVQYPDTPAPAPVPVVPERPLSVYRDSNKKLHLRVVGVHDGDTLTGLDSSKTQFKIRLDAIDAPELGQAHGQASKRALSEKVFGKDVVVVVKTRDKYGRTVGHVLIDRRDVNLEMLEEGMAWH